MNATIPWERYIGLKPMVGAKVDGEAAGTPVVIIDAETGEVRELVLETDDDIANFLVGNLPVEWRDAMKEKDTDDVLRQNTIRWFKVRKNAFAKLSANAITRHNENGELEVLRIATKFDGIKPKDKVGVLASSRGALMIGALVKRAQEEAINLNQIHTRHLHARRSNPNNTEDDAKILAELTMKGASGVYTVRPSDATAAEIGKLFATRQRTQLMRIAHGNRVRDVARQLHLAMKMAKARGERFTFDQAAMAVGVEVNEKLNRLRELVAKLQQKLLTEFSAKTLAEFAQANEKLGKLQVTDRYAQVLADAEKYLSALNEGQAPTSEEVFQFATAANMTWVALRNEEKMLEEEMAEKLGSLPIGQKLLGVKGVGPAIAGGIIGLILDPRRFEREQTEEETELRKCLDEALVQAEYNELKELFATEYPDDFDPSKTSGFQRIANARKYCLETLNDPIAAEKLQRALEILKQLKRFNGRDRAKARLRSYAGCAPHGGEFFCARRGGELSCNRDLRQRLYQLGSMWVKRYKNPGDWIWAHHLNENIASYRQKHPEPIQVLNRQNKMVWRYKDGHIIKMAMWKTLSEFLGWLFDTWIQVQKDEANALKSR